MIICERKGATHSSNSLENSALLGKSAGLYRKEHELIEVSLLRGCWLLARCWDWEGGREVIGLQVAPAGTEDPEEKPEVCHLTCGDPSDNVVEDLTY